MGWHGSGKTRISGPAADGASFSLNSNLLEWGRSRFFLPIPRQFGAWGIVPPAFITASVNCVRAEGLSRLTSSLRETRLRGCECSADRTSLQSQNEQNLLIERADFGTAVARNWQLIQWLAAKFSYRSRLSNISAFSDL